MMMMCFCWVLPSLVLLIFPTLSICLSVCLLVCLSVGLSHFRFTYPFYTHTHTLWLSLSFSLCPSFSVCLFVCLSVNLSSCFLPRFFCLSHTYFGHGFCETLEPISHPCMFAICRKQSSTPQSTSTPQSASTPLQLLLGEFIPVRQATPPGKPSRLFPF